MKLSILLYHSLNFGARECPRFFFCHTHWTYSSWKPGKTCLHLGYFGISHWNFKGDFCEKDGQCSDMVWFLFFQLNHSQTNYSKICLIPVLRCFKYVRTMSQIESNWINHHKSYEQISFQWLNHLRFGPSLDAWLVPWTPSPWGEKTKHLQDIRPTTDWTWSPCPLEYVRWAHTWNWEYPKMKWWF